MRIPQQPPKLTEVIKNKKLIWKSISDRAYAVFVRECEEKYWHWDIIRRVATQRNIDPELAWLVVKSSRIQRYKYLSLAGKNDAPLCFVVPDKVQQELMMIDRELAGQLASEDDQPLAEEQKSRFILSASTEEAIASSMLEGAVTTRKVAKQMLATGRKPRTLGERMVLNNFNAIQFIRQHRHRPLSPEFMLEVQSILTQKTMDQDHDVGRFRQSDDNIHVVDSTNNEIIHEPPPAQELAQRIEKLCVFANTEGNNGFIHPVIKACIIHFQIGYDHPFCDGNGRTARALFYWYMLKQGYWLFEYLPISRLIYKSPAQYVEAYLYSEHDEFDLTYFLDYNLQKIAQARQDLRTYLKEKQAEAGRARQIFTSDPRLNHRQREVLLGAIRNAGRAITIASHKNQHAVTYATARNDLLELAAWGYLAQRRVSNRFEFLAADKLTQAKGLVED